MKRPMAGAIVIAVVQASIVASLAVRYSWDRQHLPRAWARARPDAVPHAVAGRYLTVPLLPVTDGDIAPRARTVNDWVVFDPVPVTLEARGGGLVARKAPASRVTFGFPRARRQFRSRREADLSKETSVLWPAVELFVPPSAGDPKRLIEGELWLEVSVPPQGAPRALRAGRMKDGRVEPITE